ncbi:pteridine reductase [Dechloromonas sp. A34]|uniref:pteridine reductase n=1 Tax=Dechloromonas sp. A34 TaxID=447588 RepID=UPI0022489FA0|nr:pteridine reductase [Dechloromonas sp. A34]
MSQPTVLVTGASRRVGAAIVRELHQAGLNVAIHYRHSAAPAAALADELNALRPASAAIFAADLDCLEDIPGLVDAVISRFGGLFALVNNASTFFPTPVGSVDAAIWDNLLSSNLRAPFFLAQAAAPHLKASGGSIVNITDIHAERPLAGFPVYCAAKGGLLNLTRALAIELAPAIRANAVAPGAIDWPEDRAAFSPKEQAAIVEHTLLKRVGTPRDVARAVKFLILDAPYVTGQVLNIDGGRSAHLSSPDK